MPLGWMREVLLNRTKCARRRNAEMRCSKYVVRSEGRALDKINQGRQCSNQLVMYRHSAAGAASPPAPVLTEKGLWMRGRGEVHFDVRRKAVLGGVGVDWLGGPAVHGSTHKHNFCITYTPHTLPTQLTSHLHISFTHLTSHLHTSNLTFTPHLTTHLTYTPHFIYTPHISPSHHTSHLHTSHLTTHLTFTPHISPSHLTPHLHTSYLIYTPHISPSHLTPHLHTSHHTFTPHTTPSHLHILHPTFTSHLHILHLKTHIHTSHLTFISYTSPSHLTSHVHTSHLTFTSYTSPTYLTYISFTHLTSHTSPTHFTNTSPAHLTYTPDLYTSPTHLTPHLHASPTHFTYTLHTPGLHTSPSPHNPISNGVCVALATGSRVARQRPGSGCGPRCIHSHQPPQCTGECGLGQKRISAQGEKYKSTHHLGHG